MFKKVVAFLVFVLVFSVSLNAQKSVDASLAKCYGTRYHDLGNNPIVTLDVFEKFEGKLLESGMLQDKSQESYTMLMANVLNDDIEIPVSLWDLDEPELSMLSMPSNLQTAMLCFDDAFEDNVGKLDGTSSVIAMSPFVKKLISDYNLGNKSTNIRLVRAISEEDFSKMVYKAPVLTLLHIIASYKEEMNQLTSNY